MVSPCYYPVKGGTETIVRNLAIALNRSGIKTDVMTFNMVKKWHPIWQGARLEIDGLTVYKIPALNWLPIAHSNRLTLGINLIPGKFRNIMSDYDIVHFNEVDFSFPLFSLPIKKAKIFHVHGINSDFFKKNCISRQLLTRLSDIYISISHRMTEDLIDLGIDARKVFYVPNGVDTNLFVPKGTKEENVLLFVGRLNQGKGLHVLLKALPLLKTSVKLVIVGPADWHQDYYKDLMQTIAVENRAGRHKIIYLGPLEPSELVKWYQQASLFVLPSFAEGFPVTALEALSCETPVIATAVGGIPEVITSHETGLLVPLNNPSYLADSIQYLIDNRNVCLQFGKEGRKRVIAKYSLDSSVKKLSAIYEQLSICR
ncbi:MAG: glycosyltransferase family 4 protein [Candidatus Bathyarchaeia archaeon]|jgi:glycosyltransferase involved in cell wall biosynthesis